MADLENLLLEAAGRTGSSRNHRHSRPQSRRQREGSYSDDGSDSKDELSDEDHGYPNRKPSGSQIPLKKRERDDDRGSRDDDDGEEGDERGGGGGGSRDSRDSRDSGEESDVGSDLYKDEYDREQLAQMTELEREMILSDRAQRRDDQRLTERVRAKQSVKKAPPLKEMATPVSGASRVRSSARSAERASAKDDALNELRAKRMKQQDQEGFRRSRDARDGRDGAAAAANRDRDRDSSPLKRGRSSVAVASVSSESSDSESGSESSRSRDEGSAGNDELGESDEEKSSGKDALSIEDIKTVTIRRSKLAKWLLEPFFEEVVVGCFVRLGIGKDRNDNSIYRLCKVLNIDASDPDKQYVLEGKSTNKYLHVIFGKSEARWQMDRVSNSPPLEKEFKEWVAQMEKTGAHMPSKSELAEKQEAIQKAITYVYSAATVKQMLHEKKTASTRPLNVAAEKARLRRELEKAQSKQNGAEIDRIQTRLQELEKISREKDVKAVRLEEMNKRNRAENFKNASEMKPVNTSLKAGEAGYDPFSRRWTRSRNYYVSDSNGANGVDESVNGDAPVLVPGLGANVGVIRAADGVAATVAALEAAAGAGKLVDTSAPVDQGTFSNSLHNFELSISLAELQKFGGPQGVQLGFMARKQQIEATVGCQVPESDGRRHPLTLSVSDYKRRRGLL